MSGLHVLSLCFSTLAQNKLIYIFTPVFLLTLGKTISSDDAPHIEAGTLRPDYTFIVVSDCNFATFARPSCEQM